MNEAGLDIIRRYEGLKLKPYLCPAGAWTIGYGSRRGVTEDSPTITEEEAEERLRLDAEDAARTLRRMVWCEMNENQRAAVECLIFNIGAGNFRNSTLRSLLNKKSYLPAANEFPRWVYATVDGEKEQLGGLTKRRAEERALFLKPVLLT